MSIYDPIVAGDATLAVVYRLTDQDGRIWRSSPYLLPNSQWWDSDDPAGSAHHSDSWVRIPTLRHLMAGTVAEIELYFGQVDLQLFIVLPNDPTVNYIDYYPKHVNGGTWGASPPDVLAFASLAEAVAYQGAGETLYTTGGALENAPPPIARCAYLWRNRVFVAHENTIWPSQEIEEGLGVRWNEVTRIRWEDGTGDILAICHIDWNYLALFKRDAIGIVSGPGPDGLGSGNYLVQTLATKAGCSNPKSIVNGADGVYYQDSATGRIMLLGPSLQPVEAAPGAFDASTHTITCAFHVEQARQVWFFARHPTSLVESRIVVLDYKHRTETSPAGAVYQWTTLNGMTVVGMAMLAGVPTLLMSDGSTCRQVVGQWSDDEAGGVHRSYYQQLVTGNISPFGPQRQFNVSRVMFLGEYASEHTVRLDVTPGYGTANPMRTKRVTAGPEQAMIRPENCMRVQAIQVGISEVIVTGGTPPATIIGPGFKFVGLGLELQDSGKLVALDVGRNF